MIKYLEHHIVDHCNLNCAGCSHFSPLARPWFEDLEGFYADFKKLAEMTEVGTIRLMGGEPLLHPDHEEFCVLARELFPKSEIHLVTNGLLADEDRDLPRILAENNIVLCVSDYELRNNVGLQKIEREFARTRIDRKSCMYNICLHENKGDRLFNFQNCDIHQNQWFYFQNGHFFHCCVGANVKDFDAKFRTDYRNQVYGLSIYNNTMEEILDFLSKPIPLCAHCDTIQRQNSYAPFKFSLEEKSEWTCP